MSSAMRFCGLSILGWIRRLVDGGVLGRLGGYLVSGVREGEPDAFRSGRVNAVNVVVLRRRVLGMSAKVR
jgi:hypothetical protein